MRINIELKMTEFLLDLMFTLPPTKKKKKRKSDPISFFINRIKFQNQEYIK